MATQVLTRKQMGDMIALEDIVELNPQTYFVKSQSSRGGYSVTRFGQSWTCDCPRLPVPGNQMQAHPRC